MPSSRRSGDPGPVVVDGFAGAAALVAEGVDVVVVLAEGVVPVARPVGTGRLAVLIGDFRLESVRSAAAAMGAELWGA